MKKLTTKQSSLLSLVKNFSGSNTHELAQLRGDRQAYESNLRDRLFNLEKLGLIKSVETKSVKNPHWVISRVWEII